MLGNEQVDLATVVFVAGEAFVNLRLRQGGEAVVPQRIDSFTILEQANHVMDANSGAFCNGVTAWNPGGMDDVAVGCGGGTHNWRVGAWCLRVNRAASGSCCHPTFGVGEGASGTMAKNSLCGCVVWNEPVRPVALVLHF